MIVGSPPVFASSEAAHLITASSMKGEPSKTWLNHGHSVGGSHGFTERLDDSSKTKTGLLHPAYRAEQYWLMAKKIHKHRILTS